MKKAGIVIIVVGLLFTIVTGFRFFTKKKVVDLGQLQISRSEPHRVRWSPYVGVGIMIVGGAIFLFSPKK